MVSSCCQGCTSSTVTTDENSTRIGVTLFEFLSAYQPVVLDFIVYNGLDWLTKVKEQYAADELLALSVPKLIRGVLGELA